MNTVKFHLLNIATVFLFSYAVSLTVTDVIAFSISTKDSKKSSQSKNLYSKKNISNTNYDSLLKNGFFPNPEEQSLLPTGDVSTSPTSSITNLTLLGTVYGPSSIARAMIKKRGAKSPGIFALRKINKKINNDVYGNKLVKIETNYVLLIENGQKVKLELFTKKKSNKTSRKSSSKRPSSILKKNISRSEIMQKVGNIDEAMKGLVVSHYRVNGKMVGYRLKKVRSSNILYKLGARSGDIVKRVNGHSINSTEKLMKLYKNINSETKIELDIERRGKPLRLDYNITN